MQHVAVVVNNQVTYVPLMCIDKPRFGEMGHERVKESGAIVIRAGRHVYQRSLQPIHLAVLAKIEGWFPSVGMNSLNGLALGALMWE